MKKNDRYPMTADNLGADMEGVCRHEGMAVFVPGLLPGESAEIHIVKAEKNYAFGKMVSAPDPVSPDRREPDCPVFPRCGGCSCRHMSYEATLKAKERHIADCMARIAKVDAAVPPVIGMEDPRAYRNKTALPVAGTAAQPVTGFFAPRSHDVIPVTGCPNAMAPAGKVAEAVLYWMKTFGIEPYREGENKGVLRHLVIRTNRKGESQVTLVINAGNVPHLPELRALLAPMGVISLFLNINRTGGNVILTEQFKKIFGPDTLTDTLCGLSFELSPGAFFQVNPLQTEKLYETALAFAELKETDTLCDVYCGAGTITLMMARRCRTAVGIEIVAAAVQNAEENAARNGIANASFVTGKAEEVLPKMVKEGLRPDVIVVDPPRKGLDPAVIDAIAQAGPSRLVYISCNVATQARDIALLTARGYALRKVQGVDMFPYTSHIENVCLLEARS